MRKLAAFPPLLIGTFLLFGLRTPLAPVPAFEPLSEPMKLDFNVSKIQGKQVELSLKGGAAKGPLFLQFEVGASNGTAEVTLNLAGNSTRLGGNAPGENLPDWSFLKSRDGKTVLDFSFENQLVELSGGEKAVRMKYVGPPVPLLRRLVVARPTTMPPFVAKELGHTGPIQLERGTYPIDSEGAATVTAKLLGN